MGQHCSECSLRAGLESVWHWTFAGAQWAHRALLAGTFWQVQGKGALLTPVAGAGLCVAVRQQEVVQDCSLEKCSPPTLAWMLSMKRKLKDRTISFSMPPCIHCVGTLHINRLISARPPCALWKGWSHMEPSVLSTAPCLHPAQPKTFILVRWFWVK